MKVLGFISLALTLSIKSIALVSATTKSHNRENPGVTDTSVSGTPSSNLGPASSDISIIWRVGEEVNTPEQFNISLIHLNGISQIWGHYRGYLILSLGPVVQRLEHPYAVQMVVGSNPAGPTTRHLTRMVYRLLSQGVVGSTLNPRYSLPSKVRILEMPQYTGKLRCIFSVSQILRSLYMYVCITF